MVIHNSFLAVPVLSRLKFSAFYRNGSKNFIRINDITEKVLQNAVVFELCSMLQCRDIEQKYICPCGGLIDYIPALTYP